MLYLTLLAVGAARAPSPPVIDGRLDDAVWIAAPADTDFTQKLPRAGAPPSEPTTVRFLYDDDAIYVAIDCRQERAPITARLTRRDREVESDRVELDLDTRHDGRSAFHFEVDAAGVLVDGLRYDDTELALDWDEIWEGATARRDGGWSAELRVPLRVVRFGGDASQTWGVQVRRYVSATRETDELAYIPLDAGGEVSHYATLGPLAGLRPSAGIELRPFVLGQAGDGAERLSAGADARWHATPDLVLDATVNPDFGQVEADQVLLNLSNIETFFPEKRPFFLEGLDVFATPIALLYTRRIGHVPDAPDPPAGETLVERPGPSSIYGAAKLAGRIGGGFTVGAISAMTGEQDLTTRDMAGAEHEVVADPRSFFEVLRLKRELGGHGHVGLAATAALRGAGLRDAYVGGVDFAWRSPGGAFTLGGQALGSAIEGGATRTLPDGTTIASGARSAGGTLTAAKEGGDFIGDAGIEAYGRTFDPNDLGYLPRQNVVHAWVDAAYRDTDPGRYALETRQQVELYGRKNLDGLTLPWGVQFNTRADLVNGWSYFAELHYRGAHFDDREIGDGTALERAGLWGLEIDGGTDPRCGVAAEAYALAQLLPGGVNLEADVTLKLRLLPQLDVDVEPQATYTSGEPRFAGADGSTLLFGKLRAASLGATIRTTWTFTPRLTLQAYAQLFLADGHFADFSSPMGTGRVVHLSDLAPAAAPADNPDFQEGALNANVVLRWEYRPGSQLFLVYSRAQAPEVLLDPGERPRLDLAAVGRAAATDLVLFKLSYWWG